MEASILICFVFAFTTVHSTRLSCSSNPTKITVYDNPDTIEYPGGGQKYGNKLDCRWLFVPSHGGFVKLSFDYIQMERCHDYVTVNGGGSICSLPGVAFIREEILLHFHSDHSNVYDGFRATIRRLNPLCDFSRSIAGEALTIFRLNTNLTGSSDTRGINLIRTSKTNINSRELVWPGSPRGLELCWGNSTIFPESEIPSCNAGFLATCQWNASVAPTKTPLIDDEEELADKVFSSTALRFATKSSSLALERVCLVVKYQTDDAVLRLYALSAELGDELLAEESLSSLKNTWGSVHIAANVSGRFQQTNISLVLEVKGPRIVKVKMIQGCNAYRNDDRYILNVSSDHTDIMPLNYIPTRGEAPREIASSDKCKNKGILIEKTQNCSCPAGSTGRYCEIGCGPNRIGPNCEVECSSLRSECGRMIICKQKVGCYCAPGWKGHNCDHKCSYGEYGIGCSQHCGKCEHSSPCDIYTGKCWNLCAPGYVPPMCQSKMAYLKSSPIVTKVEHTSATLQFQLSSNNIEGTGSPKFYGIQYRRRDRYGSWTKERTRRFPKSGNVSETISYLKSAGAYEARVVLFDDQLNSYQDADLPKVEFDTSCSTNVLNITASEIGEDFLELMWEGISEDETRCEYNDYYVHILEENHWKQFRVNRPTIKFDSLLPGKTYHFKVKAIGKIGQPYYFASVTTLHSETDIINDFEVVDIGRYNVSLKWKEMKRNETDLPEYLVTYKCLQVLLEPSVDCSNETNEIDTADTVAVIEDLRPFTRYAFGVKRWTYSNYTEIMATTKLFVNDPRIELADVSFTNSTIDVKWSLNCEICQLFVGGYFVKLEFQESIDGVQSAGKSLTFVEVNNFSFRNLRPGTTFKLEVYLSDESRNIISSPFTAVVRTKSSVPTAVRDLTVYKVGRNLAGLRWSGPSQTFGDLESFVVSYGGKRSVHKPSRCPAWPDLYCHTVVGLAPETDYDISVSARNDIVAEDGDASHRSVKTIESGPEAPVDLAVSDVTERDATLTWRPPGMFNGVIRSFLIKIEHIESSNASDCCDYYPKIEVPFAAEQPLYETQVTGLKSGSTYAASLMAETVWLGPPGILSFSTRPDPPSSVILPSSVDLVLNQGSPPKRIVWPQTSDSQVQPFPSQRNFLILVPGGVAGPNPLAVDGDLLHLIRRKFGDSFNIVAEYKKGDVLTLAVGNVAGSIQIPELSKGQDYRIWALTINTYCGLNNFKSVDSLPFKAE